MCLVTEQKEPFIAEKDITVYKKVRIIDEKHVNALVYDFVYELNELYETEMIANNEFVCHCDEVSEKFYTGNPYLYTNVHEAFHSMTLSRSENLFEYNTLVEAIIPKGSLYYKDKTGLFASNKIIIKKIVKTEEIVM